MVNIYVHGNIEPPTINELGCDASGDPEFTSIKGRHNGHDYTIQVTPMPVADFPSAKHRYRNGRRVDSWLTSYSVDRFVEKMDGSRAFSYPEGYILKEVKVKVDGINRLTIEAEFHRRGIFCYIVPSPIKRNEYRVEVSTNLS